MIYFSIATNTINFNLPFSQRYFSGKWQNPLYSAHADKQSRSLSHIKRRLQRQHNNTGFDNRAQKTFLACSIYFKWMPFIPLSGSGRSIVGAWTGGSWIFTYVENMKCSCCVIIQCTLQNAAAAAGDRSISNEGPRDLWKIDCGRQPLRLIQVLITVVPHDW